MTLVSELNAALERPSTADVTATVHELVANALSRLDPRLEITTTDYFNHSFVPDLVLRWNHSEVPRERYVHLRFSVLAEPFEQDLDMLGDASPMFIGMTDTHGFADMRWSSATNGTLVAQSAAIDDLGDAVREDARSRRATGPLVQVGHGLLDEPKAESVGQSVLAALRAIESRSEEVEQVGATVTLALDALRVLLPEPGEVDVERVFHSEWIRRGRDPYEFPGREPWRPELLDRETLRDVLVSLLESDRLVQAETWQRNAGFISAEDIGGVIGRDLGGGAFNAMAHALLPNWTAQWVWAERAAGVPLFENYAWFVSKGLLGLEANDLRVYFGDDGRHFKDKERGNPLPRLNEAQEMLSEPGVQTVGLLGPQEEIRYEPRRGAGHVYERLEQVLGPVHMADYRVHSVTTIVPGTDWLADLDVDRQIIDMRGQSTPIAQLARLAARFFSRAPSSEGLDHFLATGEPPSD
jgi:hypothetical protein